MVNGSTSWPRAGRLIAAVLFVGMLTRTDVPPAGSLEPSTRTLAERRIRPLPPAGPTYAIGTSFDSSPERNAAAFERLALLIGDWKIEGTFSARPDLPLRDLSGSVTIDWELRGMQLRIASDMDVAGPETQHAPPVSREVMYLAWSERDARYDAVHMASTSSRRRWLAGEWSEETDTLTLFGAPIGESVDPGEATMRIELTYNSDGRWAYRTAVRDPSTKVWLDRADALLVRVNPVQHTVARDE